MMHPLRATRKHSRSMLRIALLLTALATYVVSPDDVVWRFIRGSLHCRTLEHLAFSIAAVLLGIALCLKVRSSTSRVLSPAREALGSLLQAIGIGFLLPLPGFLLFVLGDLSITLLFRERQPAFLGGPAISQSVTWTGALAEHIGLCCAIASMIVFSIVLVDRVADALFTISALISLFASSRRALLSNPSRS